MVPLPFAGLSLVHAPKLLDLVGQCAAHQQSEDHRELAFVILNELTETVGNVLTAHFGTLQGIFLQALKDPRRAHRACVDCTEQRQDRRC